ncbi:MAG: hypothetical protein R3B06_04385 [Kofleriaceae bacterium]
MQHRRWLACVAMSALWACDDGGPSTPAPGGCELVVAAASECPSAQELCAGHCGGAHDCCYPMGDGWGDVITDCNPCLDGGVDAPAAASAACVGEGAAPVVGR